MTNFDVYGEGNSDTSFSTTVAATYSVQILDNQMNEDISISHGEVILVTAVIWTLSIAIVVVSVLASYVIIKLRKNHSKSGYLPVGESLEGLIVEKNLQNYDLLYQNSIFKQREGYFNRLKTMTTFYGNHQPFVSQFSGRVDFSGGEISSPKSAVKVIVPMGAIPKELGEQIIYVNVALDGTQFNLKSTNKEIQVCPVVECLAPGLKLFNKPVTIKLPHRADIRSGEWRFTAKYSNDELSADTKWKDIPLNCYFDEDYVYIKTNHFTSFSCFGCGRGGRLKLTGVVYGNINHVGNNKQLNFRVYVCSGYQDALQQLEQLEERLGPGKIRSQPKPLILRNKKDIEVKLKSIEDKNWPWKLKNTQTDDALQMILLEHCYNSCDTPPSVDFRCVLKDDQGQGQHGTDAETVFEISQIRKDKEMMEHVQLVAQDFSPQNPVFNGMTSSPTSFSNQIPAEILNEIVSDLIVARSEVPTLFRILGLDEANIQSITNHGCRNNLKEQIYAMISTWERSRPKGQRATVEDFIQGCEKCQLNAVADKLRSFVNAS